MTKRSYCRLLEAVAALILVFSPLALGSVQPWAYKAAASAVYALAFMWSARVVKRGGFSYMETPLLYFPPLFAALFVLQLVPLPSGMVELVSPGRVLMRQAAGLPAGLESLSVYPWAAFGRSAFYLSALLLFFLVINYISSSAAINRLRYLAVGTGAFVALMLFAQKSLLAGKSTLPFINKNHFAGYMELLIPVAAASLAFVRPERPDRRTGLKARISEAVSGPAVTFVAVVSAALLAMCTAVLVTVSRGGILGMLFSFVVLGVLVARDRKRAVWILALLALFFVLALEWSPIDRLSRRMSGLSDISSDRSASVRLAVWKDSLGMVSDFPVFGAGPGGFETVYPMYKTIMREYHVFQPESDYLYVLAETGVAGFLLVGAFVFAFAAIMLRRYYARGSLFVLGSIAGALASLAALLFHGLVDTSLHMPAILMTFAVIMGLAYSAAHRIYRSDDDGRLEVPVRVVVRGSRRRTAAVVLFGCVSLALCVFMGLGAAADAAYASAARQREKILESMSVPPGEYLKLVELLETACIIEPRSSEYSFELGRAYHLLAEYVEALDVMGEDRAGLSAPAEYYEKALAAFEKAVTNNPYSSFAHLMAGRILEHGLGREAEGEAEYAAAERLNPTSPFIKRYLSGYYGKKEDLRREQEYAGEVPYLDPKYNPVEILSLVPEDGVYAAKAGKEVTWTAMARVPVGELEYRFGVWRPGEGWVAQRPYGPDDSWSWDTTDLNPGRYLGVVWARRYGERSNGVKLATDRPFVLTE